MKIMNQSKALSAVSNDVSSQKSLERKEKALQEFVKQCPITIEYGCHTIELKPDTRMFNGHSFHAKEDDGKGIKISIN